MGNLGSNNRSSYPANKQVPLMRGKNKDVFGKNMDDWILNTGQRKIIKQMHNKKVRSFAQNQIEEQLMEEL